MNIKAWSIVLAGLLLVFAATGATAQAASGVLGAAQTSIGNGLTYQGRLVQAGIPAQGSFDFRFALYDQPTGGSPQGNALALENVLVVNGLFSVELDFQMTYDGTAFYLQAEVRDGNSTGAYTLLSPRQKMTAAPYALLAKNLSGPLVLSGAGDTASGALVSVTAGNGYAAIDAYSLNQDAVDAESGSGNAISGKSASGYAGYFEGNVKVTGTLTLPSITLRVDHPLEPQSKILDLAGMVADEQMIEVSGNALLGPDGRAEIPIPAWFPEAAGTFRYQLTPLGSPAPGLYVAAEIQNGHFEIAGGPAGLKVSWQVTGTRQDAYALAHPFQAEQQKPVGVGQ
jgi:hypothetical protein